MANEMIEKPKLNFFQRLRKSFLMRKITLKKYDKAPDYLRDDEDVIQALLYADTNNINRFPLVRRIEFVEKYDGLFENLPPSNQNELLDERPDFILKFGEEKSQNYLVSKLGISYDRDKFYKFIKFMPEEFQIKMLTEKIEYGDYKQNWRGEYERDSINPNIFKSNLDAFTPDAVEKAVILLVEKAKKSDIKGEWQQKQASVPLLSDMKIDNLPVETQLKITLLDNTFLDRMSDEATQKYVGDNPLLLKKLSPKKQIAFIKNNPKLFSTLNWGEKRKLLEMDYQLQSLIPEVDRLKMSNVCYDRRLITDPDVVKKYIINSPGKMEPYYLADVTDTVRDKDVLLEVARFEPLVLNAFGSDDFKRFRKYGHVTELFKYSLGPYPNEKVVRALDNMKNTYRNISDGFSQNMYLSNVGKVVLNKDIMAKADPEIVSKYISNPNMEDLRTILISAYGEHVGKILDERPQMELNNIPTLDIFSPIVYEKFGEVTIHNMLSYKTNGALVLGELVRNPQKMEKFEMLSRITGSYFENTVTDFDKKLLMYKKIEKILSTAREEDFTEERKENLILAINDRYMSYEDNEISSIPLDTLEDLDNYVVNRNKVYDDYMMKTTSANEIKDMISRRFFGIEKGDGVDSRFEPNVITLNNMIYYYNVETFVQDERTQESELFTNDELDMLELATIIQKVDDPETLREIYKSLAAREDIIKPIEFAEMKKKIPLQYSRELLSTLLTPEKARERVQAGEEGISIENTEDGYEIINLHGADFRILMHTTGINNSQLNLPYRADQVDIWNEFENGCSTISASVIEAEMLHACTVDGYLILGFSNVPEKQILGMSHHDAHVSHNTRLLNPAFDYAGAKFNYSDELMRKTAAQITGQEQKDTSHEYNEVAMYRRMIENDRYEEGSFGGRVMPDYIVVFGKATAQAKNAAKRFGKDGKPIPIIEIDKDKYYDRAYARGHISRKEDHTKERPQGEVVKNVVDIVNKNEQDER